MKPARFLLILLLAAFVLAVGAEAARAADISQEAEYLWHGENWRGQGQYMNWYKIGVMWALFLIWAGVADWVNRDMEENGLHWQMWNPIVVGSFMGTFVLTLLIPWFALSVILLLAGAIAPIASYIVIRNGLVASHQQVLTKAHLRFTFAEVVNKFGGKMSGEMAGIPISAECP